MRARRLTTVAAALLLALTGPGGTAVAAPAPGSPDPTLDQSIAPDQPISGEPAVLSAGHVDIGPRYLDDRWTLLIHDDAADAVWRDPDRTVLRVTDAAIQPVPDDPGYAFLGVPAGTGVHVVPQVQHPEVVWVGWNTQDPRVMSTIDRGVTLELAGVQGPGAVAMFVQSGTFGEPQVLWRSTEPAGQPMWVEVNTHTHANWVFTEPGVYLVGVRVSAELVGGEQVSAVRHLRFAVGDATDPEQALAAVAPTVSDPATPVAATDGGPESAGGIATWLVVALAATAAALAGALLAVLLRGRSARRRAERDRAGT